MRLMKVYEASDADAQGNQNGHAYSVPPNTHLPVLSNSRDERMSQYQALFGARQENEPRQ